MGDLRALGRVPLVSGHRGRPDSAPAVAAHARGAAYEAVGVGDGENGPARYRRAPARSGPARPQPAAHRRLRGLPAAARRPADRDPAGDHHHRPHVDARTWSRRSTQAPTTSSPSPSSRSSCWRACAAPSACAGRSRRSSAPRRSWRRCPTRSRPRTPTCSITAAGWRRHAARVAVHVGLRGEELEAVAYGALLHDVGKIGVPGYLLRKEGPLSRRRVGADARATPRSANASAVRFRRRAVWRRSFATTTSASTVAAIPTACAAKQIPLGARIVAIADAYEAMVHGRPYQPARTHERGARRAAAPARPPVRSGARADLHRRARAGQQRRAAGGRAAVGGDAGAGAGFGHLIGLIVSP